MLLYKLINYLGYGTEVMLPYLIFVGIFYNNNKNVFISECGKISAISHIP